MDDEYLNAEKRLWENHLLQKDLLVQMKALDSQVPDVEKQKQIGELVKQIDEINQQSKAILSSLPSTSTSITTAGKGVLLLDRCTDRTIGVLRLAGALGAHRRREEIHPQDILDALSHGGGVSEGALQENGHTKAILPSNLPSVNADSLNNLELVKRIIDAATDEAERLDHRYVGTEHLLLALMRLYPELVPDAEQVRVTVLEILGPPQSS